jgi:hypothetical protein
MGLYFPLITDDYNDSFLFFFFFFFFCVFFFLILPLFPLLASSVFYHSSLTGRSEQSSDILVVFASMVILAFGPRLKA